ncbi:hypothetical protein [Sinosporangium siamense]|uniref:DUF559 domain-containing protein n=1 Tax=Sinosporangium siamense TaxID=1367973 RepID=A0A919RKJ0_9ACTN|nr:hypothetical protein [Sinosporangium siamense]GII94932.1 hypothetical protein Ssi02_51630 [Sinosporangium siamense]
MTSPTRGSQSQAEELPTTELILAQTAFYLDEQGDVEAAAVLIDAEGIDLLFSEENFGRTYHRAVLNVPGWVVSRLTDDLIERIQAVVELIAARQNIYLHDLKIGAAIPSVGQGWRQSLYSRLSGERVTNHAVRTDPDPRLRRDQFNFESLEEIRVYDSLKRAQVELSKRDQANTISIFPLPLGRVGTGSAWTPDFLIVREGRVGLIEVDGPYHRGRAGADATRDRHWKNSGIVHIERILVEETVQNGDLDQVVRAFLKRMLR